MYWNQERQKIQSNRWYIKKNALKFGTEFNTIYFTAVD